MSSDIPENAPSGCPGVRNEQAGKSSACAGCPNQKACSTGEQVVDPDIELIRDRLNAVKNKILVVSGKGGVGKSTVTTNLALALASSSSNGSEMLKVGVLDIDICGPSQARMFGCEDESVHDNDEGWSPIQVRDNLMLMSIAFLLESRNEAVIWRGPRKNALIKKFLRDVDWGELDYLLIDTPPGTSDEHISVVQLLMQSSSLTGAIIITTPQEMSLLDVRKEINFCQKTKVPILGVVEMSKLFPSTTGGAEKMCSDASIPLLVQLPHDPELGRSVDDGIDYFKTHTDSVIVEKFKQLAKMLMVKCSEKE